MKVKDQLRTFREDGTLNILINMNKYEPAILDYLEWWDFFEAEKAKGNTRARKTTYRHFKGCSLEKFMNLRKTFETEVPEIDWVTRYQNSQPTTSKK